MFLNSNLKQIQRRQLIIMLLKTYEFSNLNVRSSVKIS